MLKRKCETEGDIPKAIDLLKKSAGIEVSDKLSIWHIYESLDNLESINDYQKDRKVISFESAYTQALMGLALKVKTRTK